MAMGGQPVFPDDAARLATPDNAYGVFVSGEHAYLANSLSGLRIGDISEPSSPREMGAKATPGHANGVFVSGNHAFVADWDGGLVVARVDLPGV